VIGPHSIVELPADIEQPDLLDETGHIRLKSYRELGALNFVALRLWCHHQARYGLVTSELVLWLNKEIRGRNAIEIGAGHGDLAHYLGIPATDSYNQFHPEVRAMYEAMKQPIIQYPATVFNMDARTAVDHFKPDVIVASWVTQWIDPALPPPSEGGSVYGIKEDEFIDAGVTYILIGNESIHGEKKIMQRKHDTFSFAWLVSRSIRPALNRIWIWNR
jgi:hypothetical protein